MAKPKKVKIITQVRRIFAPGNKIYLSVNFKDGTIITLANYQTLFDISQPDYTNGLIKAIKRNLERNGWNPEEILDRYIDEYPLLISSYEDKYDHTFTVVIYELSDEQIALEKERKKKEREERKNGKGKRTGKTNR